MNKKPAKPKKTNKPEPLRAAAETRLAYAPKPKPYPAEKLLHELQVHQIELEMQNEQLRQAQIALEESRDRYVDLYEFAPVGYLTLTDTGMIGEINLTGAKLLGMERKKLLRRRFGTFVTPEYRERWNSLFIGVLRQCESNNCELSINSGDGKRLYVQLNCKRREKEGAAPMVRITLTDITLLRKAEEVMLEWQRFVECAHWGMIVGRVEDRAIRLANPAFARMHGYTMEELHGIRADKLYAPESRADIPKIVEILSSAGCYSFECMRLRKDGSTFPALVDVATIHEANGKPVYVASVTDITERKRAENALKLYKIAIETALDGFWMVDIDGYLLHANKAYAKMSGYTTDELVNMHISQLEAIEETDMKVREHMKKIIAQGFDQFQTRHRRKDGHEFDVEVTTLFIPETQGFFGFIRDITERKRAEESLRKSAKEIEDLYNNAPCGYHSLDKDGTICLMNDTELSWLGYASDEIIGKVKWPDLLTRAGVQRFKEDFPQLMKQGVVKNIEADIIRKDGTTFNGLINATAIYDPRGNFVMSRSTVTDITARKKMERQLHDLHAHLQTVREEEKASIAREIHDDLGGTLTALKMESYRLAEELSADEKAAPLLEHIETMAKLIDNAVHVTRRVITGLRPTILDDFGLLAAIEWYAAQFSKRTGIECRVNCVTGEGCEKELDRVRSINLFRIFQEALTNVMRHSSASRVEVEFHVDDEEISLSIGDNGCGMKEKCEGDPVHYGILGMTERVDHLGGKINFISPPGGGFRVEVCLPLPLGHTKKDGTKNGNTKKGRTKWEGA